MYLAHIGEELARDRGEEVDVTCRPYRSERERVLRLRRHTSRD